MNEQQLSAAEILAREAFTGPPPGFAVEIILSADQFDIAEHLGNGDVRVGIYRALNLAAPSQETINKVLGILPEQSWFDSFPLEEIAALLKKE